MSTDRSLTLPRRTKPNVLTLCLVEARLPVQAAFLLRSACGAALASAGGPAGVRVVAGLLLCELTVVAVYLFNGAADVAGDRVNGSSRPIARGALAVNHAVGIAAGCACVAVAGATLMGAAFTAVTLASLVLGYMYSAPPVELRMRPFGAWVAGAGGGLLTYAAGGIAAGGRPTIAMVVLATSMSAWMGVVGATTKDFTDTDGDRAAGRRTLITVIGDRATRRVVVVGAPAIGVGFAGAAVAYAHVLIIPAGCVLVGSVVVAVLTHRAAVAAPYRAFMTTQLLGHVLVLTTAV